jgi:hypothetical protein
MQAHISVNGSYQLRYNRWFNMLRDQGYRLEIVQSDYMNFCESGRFGGCSTYPANSVGALRGHEAIWPTTRALVVLQTFLQRNARYRMIGPIYEDRIRPTAAAMGITLPEWNWDHLKFGPIGAKRAFARMSDALKAGPDGMLLFAHLILPHSTYIFREDCSPKNDFSGWLERNRSIRWPEQPNTKSSRERRYTLYFEQIRCTYRLLDGLLLQMRANGSLDRATVFIHGDHGSRIARLDPLMGYADLLTAEDIIDGYSTLYAVRKQGLTPSMVPEIRSIQDLFAEHALGEPQGKESLHVFLIPHAKTRLAPLFVHSRPFGLRERNLFTGSATAPTATDTERP